jgi:hypothetical protein
VIQGVFALRQAYVAEHLCENRDDPQAHCHGRCFVKKQAERHQERQERQPLDLAQVLLAPAVAACSGEVPTPPDPTGTTGYFVSAAGSYAAGFPSEVFNPPRAS